MDASTGETVVQVRPSLWDEDREQFLSLFLHETAHARYLAAALQPSNGKVLSPVRSSSFRGAILEVKDKLDELRADTQALKWRLFAGEGPIMTRLLELQKWSKS